VALSIIIPTFNEEKYLPKLLKSIKDQTVQPAEVIVSDANSQDKTRQIAKKYGCKIVAGGLPGKGRNNGAAASKQDLLLFLDADVILPKDFLEKTTKEMVRRKLDIATCFITPLSESRVDKLIYHGANIYLSSSRTFLSQLNGFCIFITRSLFNKINGFDEGVILAEDFDLLRRAKKFGRFGYLNSRKIPVSVRRLKEEGRFAYTFKMFLLQFYLLFKGGVRTDIFKYKLGRHK
jgi:glycosyltransferase involved in cell wall biosynthesis